jgi:hypothetical protein
MAFELVLPAAAFKPEATGAIIEASESPALLSLADSGSPLADSVPFTLPSTYGGGTITVRIVHAAAAATTGDFGFTAAWRRLIATDTLTDAYATAQSTTDARGGTANALENADITFTSAQIDGAVAGDEVQIQIGRDNTVGTNASGAAWIAYVIVSEA